MPEAAPYLHGDSVAWKHNVGLAWQVLAADPEPHTLPVQSGPEAQLGLGVAAFNPRHVSGAALGIDRVCHGSGHLVRDQRADLSYREAGLGRVDDAVAGGTHHRHVAHQRDAVRL